MLKKAYEISYVIFKVAESLNNRSLEESMEEQAVKILTLTTAEEFQALNKTLEATRVNLCFAADINLINQRNRDLMIKAIEELKAASVEGQKAKETAKELNLESIFSSAAISLPDRREENPEEGNSIAAEKRQSAILERIRQNNNCRLKNIQEFLPNVSERTLRYDLQKLVGEGAIERVGNGGPGSFYRLKNQ